MYNNKTILALIPARGGSKGLPGKNIKPLSGKPMIAWSIEQAKKSRYVDRTIVSTEDGVISEISGKYGAEIPFLRPARLATDKAKSIDVILHAIGWMREKKNIHDILMLLQPTSPLRLAEDIDKAIELLFTKDAEAIVSVCKAEHPPQWMNTLPKNRCMKNFIRPEFLNRARQQIPDSYRLNGAIYLGYTEYIEKQNGFLGDGTFAYVMPRERSIDIDDEADFALAQIYAQKREAIYGGQDI